MYQDVFSKSKWIWMDHCEDVNQYVEFRRVFDVSELPAAELLTHISVDSDYELWINGHLVGWNQFSNWPKERTFNSHKISADIQRDTENVIAVRAYYRGENFATYVKGKAGLIFSLVNENGIVLLSSDSSWKCRQSKTYKSGLVPKVTLQVGFTVEYNANEDDGWQSPGFDDSQWQNSIELSNSTDGYWQSLTPRPIKYLNLALPKPAGLIASGYIIRQQETEIVAKTMSSDAMISFPLHDSLSFEGQVTASKICSFPSENNDFVIIENLPKNKGIYLIYDLGCEEAGLLEIDIDAPKDTIVDIAHGEHLDDLRVRAEVGGRNYADRYICKSGRQKWLFPYRRLGCRYIEVHIPKVKDIIKIYQITIRPTTYPFQKSGEFDCSDSKLNDIWKLSARTLELCAHEHYEDCPWREQALYTCDSRMQALFGYYAFGEYDFPSASFDLLGGGMRDDDLIEITAPGRVPVNIPGFSLHWIMELWELYLYSGQADLVDKQVNRIYRILDGALSRLTSEGVVTNSLNPEHWYFYEWTEGLEADLFRALQGKPPEASLDAAYNLLLIGALRAASELGKYLDDVKLSGYIGTANKIAKSFHSVFWDDKKQLYASFIRKGGKLNYAQLTQSLAIVEEVCPDKNIVSHLCKKIMKDETLVKAELSSLLFVYEALLKGDRNYLEFILDDVRDKFGTMLNKGATSLWETVDGAEAFSRAGSLCHAWSSIFNYIAGAYILGIKPIEPGFKKINFEPAVGYLPYFKGNVSTPHGLVKVDVRQLAVKLEKPQQLLLNFVQHGLKESLELKDN